MELWLLTGRLVKADLTYCSDFTGHFGVFNSRSSSAVVVVQDQFKVGEVCGVKYTSNEAVSSIMFIRDASKSYRNQLPRTCKAALICERVDEYLLVRRNMFLSASTYIVI